jgi:chromosome segregation ATPase
VLEISGTNVSNLSDLEFSRLLRKSGSTLEMVVLRPTQQKTVREMQAELQELKRDLSDVVLDLNSTQQENQEFILENQRLKEQLSSLKDDRDHIKMECVRISKQVCQNIVDFPIINIFCLAV